MERDIVNFGCGPTAPAGFLNIDGSPVALAAHFPLPAWVFATKRPVVEALRRSQVRYGTARGLSFPPSSLDGFYASHVLEHLGRGECTDLLRRVRAWLRPRGRLRVALPDLRLLAARYVAGEIDANEMVANSHLSMDGRSWLVRILGRSHHLWMYDAASFHQILDGAGFSGIRQRECGESEFPEFADLDRMADRAADSFYFEAQP